MGSATARGGARNKGTAGVRAKGTAKARPDTSVGDILCSGCGKNAPPEATRFCPYCGDKRTGTPIVRMGGALASAGYACSGLLDDAAPIGERFPGRRIDDGREVEVQALPVSHPLHGNLTKRFCADALALENLEHPNIEGVLKVISDGDRVLVVTDGPGDGRSGWEAAKLDEGMPFAQVLKIGRACAEALDAAHRKGVIHGGPRPRDILMGVQGEVVLRSFGVRALEGTFAGEIIASDVDGDVYALASTIFELTAGRRLDSLPDLGGQRPSLLDWRSDAPAFLAGALMRGMSEDPVEGFASAREFREALDAPEDPDEAETFPTSASPLLHEVTKSVKVDSSSPLSSLLFDEDSWAEEEPTEQSAESPASMEAATREVTPPPESAAPAEATAPAAKDSSASKRAPKKTDTRSKSKISLARVQLVAPKALRPAAPPPSAAKSLAATPPPVTEPELPDITEPELPAAILDDGDDEATQIVQEGMPALIAPSTIEFAPVAVSDGDGGLLGKLRRRGPAGLVLAPVAGADRRLVDLGFEAMGLVLVAGGDDILVQAWRHDDHPILALLRVGWHGGQVELRTEYDGASPLVTRPTPDDLELGDLLERHLAAVRAAAGAKARKPPSRLAAVAALI